MLEETAPEKKPKRKIDNAELDNVKNYLAINISYDLCLCLPYKEGAAFIAAMEHAEAIKMDRYGRNDITFNTKPIEITSSIITQAHYRERKMAALLGADDE